MNLVETEAVTKTSKGSLTTCGDVHIEEAAQAARMNWGKPMPSPVPSRARSEHEATTLSRVDRAVDIFETLPSLSTSTGRAAARIAIKANGRILLFDAAEVISVEAKGNYVLLHLRSSSYMLRECIAAIEEKLNPHGFVRIHRSALVNAALVEEIRPWSTGEYVIRVRGGREYTVTRTYKKNLQLLAHSWIGVGGFAAG
jgi:DNA-binding LytR/AlgR family response regulator